MTIKTFITTLLLTASFLLFTACDSKTNIIDEQNSTAQVNVTNEDANFSGDATEGNNSVVTNDSTAISGANVDRTATPTVILTSLKLIIEKNSLNKDENTTVKVMASYSDSTTKDVTKEVEWIIMPKESASISNSTLKALKDTESSVQAKLDTKLSEKVNLNITWVVNGHVLPPEPDPKVNNSTLLGIDSNNNDVRDDVERWIYETYKDKHPIYIDIAMQAGRAYKKVLETPERAKEIRDIVNGPLFCSSYYEFEAQFFNDPILIKERIDTPVKSKYFNTKERKDIYWQYDALLSGGVYDLPEDKDMKLFCDFNTSKYEK